MTICHQLTWLLLLKNKERERDLWFNVNSIWHTYLHFGIFTHTSSQCLIHHPLFNPHSHCVRIQSVTYCNTSSTVTAQLPFSYLLLILSLAISSSFALFVQKVSESKPHLHDAHYTHSTSPVLIRRKPQAYIGFTLIYAQKYGKYITAYICPMLTLKGQAR